MLYHFITGHIRGKIPDLKQHFDDVYVSGSIKSSVQREHQPKGCITDKNDDPKDKEYIFLTANRRRMKELYNHFNLNSSSSFLKQIEQRTFGFMIDENILRNKSGVYYRSIDCWGRRDAWENCTTPFTSQPLTADCEVLVHKEISMEEICGFIKDDKEKELL